MSDIVPETVPEPVPEPVPSFPAPADILPHRPPFLFVDEIVDLNPGVSAVGRWHLTGDEWFFAGHFPAARRCRAC